MRTEQDVLKDFEKLGWECTRNDEDKLTLRFSDCPSCSIWINKNENGYSCNTIITMQEHKLLNELFQIWGWI